MYIDINKLKQIGLLVTLGLLTVVSFKVVYGNSDLNYDVNSVKVQCVMEDLQIVSTNTYIEDNPSLDIVKDTVSSGVFSDDILDIDLQVTEDCVSNFELTEYYEEYLVDNRLSYRRIEDTLGSYDESIAKKYFRIFGEDWVNKQGFCKYYPGGPLEAESNMESFKIQVWSLDSNNNWYIRSVTLEAHKEIVNTMKFIFSDLLDLPPEERTPIKTIGCYNYREGTSCHTCGVAIDINWEENAEMTNSGVITAGSYWKPYEDIYSISPDSKIVEIFKKYGFGWGGEWTSKKDYMHFSYFDR